MSWKGLDDALSLSAWPDGLSFFRCSLRTVGQGMTSEYRVLTPSVWDDFVAVMGASKGGNSGCWCTWWQLKRGDWESLGADGRESLFRSRVEQGERPGVIVYRDGIPVGWCAIGPVENYLVVCRSSVIRPSQAKGDWFVSCFVVPARYRRKGVMTDLLLSAVDFAKSCGARAIEACPRDCVAGSGASDLFVGKSSVFLRNGFVEVSRNRHDRPLLRRELG